MTNEKLHAPDTRPMRAPLLRRVFMLVAALVLAACATPAAPPPAAAASAAPPKTVLWIGNSFFYYNNSMHDHVRRLFAAANPGVKGYRATSVTISGSGLNWHDVEALFKPGGVASYSFEGDNEVVFNAFDKPFEAAIMMDCSQCPIHPRLAPLFFEYAARHSATVRRHGAEPVLFMSWAYADKPEMTEPLVAAYVEAAAANHARVVPAGLAFARARAHRPELNLYAADKRHPSLMGTYLAACTVLAVVHRQSPVGNPYHAGLAPEVAAFLQTVAWETVQAFRQPA